MGLKLIGEVALDGSGFERGLNAMASSVKGFIAGAFGLYGIESMIRKTVDTAEDLVVESKRLGIGVEQLQVLKAAAKENSTELETLAKAFEKLDVAREKALSGSAEGMKLLARFAQLGISSQDLQTKTAANLFIGPMRDKANSMSQENLGPILKDIIGRGFGELIPVLKTDLDELERHIRRMGGMMSGETAVELQALGDAFDLVSRIMVTQFGPALLTLVEKIYESALKIGRAVAGLSGAAGGATEGMGLWDLVKGSPQMMGAGARALFDLARGGELDSVAMDWGERMEAAGFNMKEALGGYAAAEEPWQDKLEQFRALLLELEAKGKALGNQKKPAFPLEPPDESGLAGRETRSQQGDARIRIGGFLGSSKDVIESIARKQVDLLQQIADNTRPAPQAGDVNVSDNDFPFL